MSPASATGHAPARPTGLRGFRHGVRAGVGPVWRRVRGYADGLSRSVRGAGRSPLESTPSEPLHCLVFYGECLEGHDPMAVRLAVGTALKLEPTGTVRLFSGRRVVMKRGVTAAKAQAHVARFQSLGARLRVEPMWVPPRAAALPETASAPRPWNAMRWTVAGAGVGGLVAVVAAMLVARPSVPSTSAAAPTPSVATWATAPPLPALAPASAPAPSAPASGAVPTAEALEAPPEDMGPEARRELAERYLRAPMHRAFAFSPSGAYGWAGGVARDAQARDQALSQCLARQPRSSDQACRVVHVDTQWIE